MKRWGVAAIAAAVSCAASANAETLHVTYWSDAFGGSTTTWDQDSNPTPIFFIAGVGTRVAVTNFVSDSGSSAYVNYSASGAFNIAGTGQGDTTGGLAIYTGTESAPEFSPGVFILGEGTVTFALAAVPEPATWALLLAGFAGLGALSLRHRRRTLAA